VSARELLDLEGKKAPRAFTSNSDGSVCLEHSPARVNPVNPINSGTCHLTSLLLSPMDAASVVPETGRNRDPS
jgi:hypothetical protein